MKLSLSVTDLATYLARQVSNFFPDQEVIGRDYRPFVDAALERVEHCFAEIKNKYFPERCETYFNHRHTDQYAMFLYLVSNTIYRRGGDLALAEKAYALNKALHALDVFYEVELPAVFFFQHPVGTVLGRGRYSDFFVVYQRCTVGGNDGIYPVLGEGVVMYGGSSIIGDCPVGSNVWLAAGTVVIGESIPNDSVVFGQSPNLTIKPTRRNAVERFFKPARGKHGDAHSG